MPKSVDTLLAMDGAKSGVPVLQMGLSDTSEALERSLALGACQPGSPSRQRMCRWCAEGVPAPDEDISPNVVEQNPAPDVLPLSECTDSGTVVYLKRPVASAGIRQRPHA